MSRLEVRRVRRGPRRVRLLAPLAIAAVAAATVITVPATALAQAPAQHASLAASSSAAPAYLIMDITGLSPLQVRNVKTGALTGLVTLPTEPGAKGFSGRTYVAAVATGNGRSYVASVYRPSPCRSWLYQFQLNSKGKPSAVTPFTALPTIGAELYSLTVSANGKMIGYAAGGCVGAPKPPTYVAVTNISTKHTTQWPVGAAGGGTVSLTATGSQLCYITGESTSEIRIISTSARPGPAAERSRVVAQPSQFGPDTWIPYAVISPDGQDVYFTTYTPAPGIQQAGQVRVLDLATGQTRVLHSPAGEPAYPQADPAVDHLLLQIQAANYRSSWLVNLDLATGKITKLAPGMGDVLSW
jgi:hypothetical protein